MPYPENTPPPRRYTGTLICTNEECGNAWAVEFVTDLGMTTCANPDDENCPDCGCEGE